MTHMNVLWKQSLDVAQAKHDSFPWQKLHALAQFYRSTLAQLYFKYNHQNSAHTWLETWLKTLLA